MKLEILNLHKSYWLEGQEIPVLKELNWQVDSGSLVSITGPSGAGKSTLLHILGTLDAPSRGQILFNGEDIFKKTPAQLAQFRNEQIGFVFQFHHLLPELTALENVQIPLRIRRESNLQAAKQGLERVGLGARLHHKPGELSGGEQQRVALARALVTKPQLLLADEPTGNLDEATGASIVQLMRELNQELGMTILMVTHNPRLLWEKQFHLRS